MADPIISGREELGFSKLYCDLPAPIEAPGHILCRASWDGFGFAALRLNALGAAPPPPADPPPSQGLLHYKYIPATAEPGVAHHASALLPPPPGGRLPLARRPAAPPA